MALKKYYVDLTSGSNSNTQDGSITDNWANAYKDPSYAFSIFASGNAGNTIEVYIRGTTAYAPAAVTGYLDTNAHTATSITVIGEGASAVSYDTSKARLEFTDIYGIRPRGYAGTLKLKNLQMKVTLSSSSAARDAIDGSSFTAGFQGICENVRIHVVNNHATNVINGYMAGNSSGLWTFVNTMVIYSGTGPMSYGLGSNASGNVKAFNCLVDGPCAEGFRKANIYNCIDVRSTLGINNDQGTRTTLNCATLDGSAGSIDVGTTIAAWDAHFTSRATGDYSLRETSTLIDAGANQSGINGGVTTDISGAVIGTGWPIGPDEFVDSVAPALSSPLVINVTDRAADGRVTTANDANGTLYVVITKSATQPTTTQIKAGQNHLGSTVEVGSANVPITSVGTKTFVAVSGLAAFTNYYAHFLHQDASTNYSNISTSAVFKTLAPTQDPYTLTAVTKATLSTLYESNAITASVNTTVSVAGGGAEIAISSNGGANYSGWTSLTSNILTGNLVKFRVTSSASLNTLVSPVATIGGVNATWNVRTKKDATAPILYPPKNKSFGGTPTLAQNNTALLLHLATAYARDNEGLEPIQPTVGQAVRYVDQGHASASDNNVGDNPNLPWLTVTKAYAACQPGQWIWIKGHTDPNNALAKYTRNTLHGIDPVTVGTAGNKITFSAWPGHTVIFQGTGSRYGINLDKFDYCCAYGFIFDGFLKAADGQVNVTKNGGDIWRCDFRNTTETGFKLRDASNYTLHDVQVHDVVINADALGFELQRCTNVTYLRCQAYRCDDGQGSDGDADGFHSYASTGINYYFCDAYDNGEDGFDVNSNAVLVGCTARNHNGSSVKLWRRVEDNYAMKTMYLINCAFSDSNEAGVKVSDGASLNMYNCTIHSSGHIGVQIKTPTSSAQYGTAHVMQNCIISTCVSYGCELQAQNTLTQSNNLYYNNGSGGTQHATGFSPTSSITSQSPLFVNAGTGDFHLQSASPARNAGVIITGTNSNYLEKDKDQRYRPEIGTWDIGCYQYSASAAPLTITTNIATLGSPIPVGGPYTVTLSATDDDNNTGVATFQLTVYDANAPDVIAPVVTPPANITLYFPYRSAGLAKSNTMLLNHMDTARATDETAPANPVVTHNLAALADPIPAGGPYIITASATDTAGNVGTANWQLTVVRTAPQPPTVPGNYAAQTVSFNQPLIITATALIAHGIAGEGFALTIQGVSHFSNGVAVYANGKITFTPTLNYSGAASYRVILVEATTGLTVYFTVPITVGVSLLPNPTGYTEGDLAVIEATGAVYTLTSGAWLFLTTLNTTTVPLFKLVIHLLAPTRNLLP